MSFNATNIKAATETKKICTTGKLQIGSKVIDISEKLKLAKSTEYRREQLDNIDISMYKKANTQCKYRMSSYGADVMPFYNRVGQLCILNFASSKNPGGGFERGVMAQEEALCYASNLHDCLKKHMSFYEYNREHLNKSQYSDGIIYTKDVLFFRNSFNNINPHFADVITCAAPNWGASRRLGVTLKENNETISRRIEQVLKVAIANENKVIVLGAFGCGVFKNDPNYVAKEMFRLLVIEGYDKYFEEIIFAMNENKGKNVEAFKTVFNLK